MKKILHLLKDNKAFNALLNKQNIVVNSSNSEALLIASAFLTLKKDMLIVKSINMKLISLKQVLK